MNPVVALLTDFGYQDHYVGAVKGAVLAACPGVTLVDIVHELPAHDVLSGAFSLAASYRAFPAGTVFMAVVDPGVGSARRPLALETSIETSGERSGYRFVGPDNGIFTLAVAEAVSVRIHEITNTALFGPDRSATFHARDIFGPVAGRLAGGLRLEEVGPPVIDPVLLALPPVRELSAGEWEGTILHVDRFGNLITTMTAAQLDLVLRAMDTDRTALVVSVEGVAMPLVRTYSDVPEGEPCALVGSSERLEVAVHRGNASQRLGAGRGAPVRVRKAFSPHG
jgi:S-adenosylmethionine hydrolase